jgi:hypothetical protein
MIILKIIPAAASALIAAASLLAPSPLATPSSAKPFQPLPEQFAPAVDFDRLMHAFR